MLLEEGWRLMFLVDFERVVKSEGEKPKDYWMLSLQDDITGWKRRCFVNRPLPGDEDVVVFTDSSGYEHTRRSSKINVIKKVSAALGGPSSGPIHDGIWASLIGRKAYFLVTHEVNPATGEVRDQVDLKFGKGIKPA